MVPTLLWLGEKGAPQIPGYPNAVVKSMPHITTPDFCHRSAIQQVGGRRQMPTLLKSASPSVEWG